MILWNGSCIVHEEYKSTELKKMIQDYPDCEVLVHPESPRSIISLADVVGSTSRLIQASKDSNKKYIIVATEKGIFYQMKKLSPNKIFLEAANESYDPIELDLNEVVFQGKLLAVWRKI